MSLRRRVGRWVAGPDPAPPADRPARERRRSANAPTSSGPAPAVERRATEGKLRGVEQPPGALTAEAGRALEALRTIPTGGADPILLGYHPVARTNPFQALLYREAWTAGVAPLAILHDPGIDELAAIARDGHRTVLHLHWLGGVAGEAATEEAANAEVDAFLARLDGVRAAGGRIAWTVHNILPHGARYDAVEARLRAGVAERADVVHVLARDTAALVAPWFELPPDKVLHVAHPSYLGAYEDYVTREQARHELVVPADALVFAVVGAIRPYKGIEGLLDAWERLPDDRPRRLVIAGAPGPEPEIEALLQRALGTPGVVLHARKIPAGQVQLFLRAADVAVLPYLRSLNSGALLLALTFGVPVILPAGGGLAELSDPAYARTFDPGDPDGLRAALLAAGELATPGARAAARAAAETRDASALSRAFLTGLRERLDRLDGAG